MYSKICGSTLESVCLLTIYQFNEISSYGLLYRSLIFLSPFHFISSIFLSRSPVCSLPLFSSVLATTFTKIIIIPEKLLSSLEEKNMQKRLKIESISKDVETYEELKENRLHIYEAHHIEFYHLQQISFNHDKKIDEIFSYVVRQFFNKTIMEIRTRNSSVLILFFQFSSEIDLCCTTFYEWTIWCYFSRKGLT